MYRQRRENNRDFTQNLDILKIFLRKILFFQFIVNANVKINNID